MLGASVPQITEDLLSCKFLLLVFNSLSDAYSLLVKVLDQVMYTAHGHAASYDLGHRSFFSVFMPDVQILDIFVHQRLKEIILRVDQRFKLPFSLFKMVLLQLF